MRRPPPPPPPSMALRRRLLLLLLFFFLSAASSCLYLHPHLLSSSISSISSILRSTSSSPLTPPLLFLFLNAVVAALIFTSGLLPLPRPAAHSNQCLDDDDDDCLKEEDAAAARPADLPEQLLASFFGDTSYPRNPFRSKPGSDLDLSFAPRPLPPFPRPLHTPSTKINGTITAPAMSLSRYRAFSDAADENVTTPLGSFSDDDDDRRLPSPATTSLGIADEKDVDQRAAAFIGKFYNQIK